MQRIIDFWQGSRPVLSSAHLTLTRLLLATVLLSFPLRAAAQFIGPLVINPISDTNITPGTSLSITVSVTNNVPANSLLWSLSSAPAGASIVNGSLPNTAVFSWQPTVAQSPSTNTVTVLVQEFGNVTNIAGRSFTITVRTNESIPTGPVISPIQDHTVSAGQQLQVTVFATNTDNTATPIVFSLDLSAPDGATITNTSNNSAIFSWTPTLDQAPDVVEIGIIATEQSDPPQDDEQFFNVNVVLTNNCGSYDDFLAAVTLGGTVALTNCPSLVLSNTIAIVNDVEIDGGGNAVITGNNLVQLFTVFAPATLTLNGVTLQGGRGTTGGAVFIQAGAQAIISNCVFQGNSAQGTNGNPGLNGADSSGIGGNGSNGTGGVSGYGGAIYNEGTLSVSFSQFFTNTSAGGNGGSGGGGGNGGYQGGNGGNGGIGGRAQGGAIFNTGDMAIDSCTFDGNLVTAGNGGTGGTNGSGPFASLPGMGGAAGSASGASIYSTAAATINASTFLENSATGGNSAAGGTLQIGNGSNGPKGGDGLGGAVFTSGDAAMTNCTFFSNAVAGGRGGDGGPGQYTAGNGGNGGNGLGGSIYCSSGNVFMVNCTIAQNRAQAGTNGVAGTGSFAGFNGSPGAGRGAGIARVAGTFWLENSILATNAPGANAFGTISDGGNNLSSDASLPSSRFKNTDAKLGPFGDNGGPTKTISLSSNSPAIDAIPPDGDFPDVDQRGVERPIGAGADIGAVEAGFFISGQITSSVGGVSDVQVSIGNASVATDPDGNFSLAVSPGIYRVTPSLTDYRFNPTSRTVSVIGNTSNVNFSATQQFRVSGRILEGSAGLGGVKVTVGASTATTDTNGTFTVSGLAAGNYTVTPALTCYFFNPASRSISLNGNGTNTADFIAGRQSYSVSGHVASGANALPQVSVAIGTNVVLTDANGDYHLSGLCAGTYTAQPSLAGYAFNPSTTSFALSGDTNGINFSAFQAFGLSGQIKEGTNALSGVTVTAGTNRVITSTNGAYAFPALPSGGYVVTPSLACYHFTPTSLPITVGPVTNSVNFTGTRDAYAISGRLSLGTNPLSGVTISAGSKSTISAANGNYVLSNLCAGNYTVIPALSGYQFQPAALPVAVGPDTNGVNFAAVAFFSISGQIHQGTNGLNGVTVSVGTNTVTTSNGTYTVGNLRAGVYQVTPALGCYRFSPSNAVIVVGPSTNTVNFTATQTLFSISGQVSDGIKGLSGVAIQISGSNNLNNTIGTDINGNYSLAGLCPGAYQVQASLAGYDFGPAKPSTITNSNVTGVNFAPFYAITGRVGRTNGIGLSGVTVSASVNGNPITNGITDANGIFNLSGLLPGAYTLQPALGGYIFIPATRAVIVTNQNVANADFDTFGPPSIVAQPKDLMTPACASATFTIVVSDDPPFFYQWQRNGTNIAGATSSAYVVPNGETTNLGVYTVIVSNAFGVILSAPATLALYPSPFICSEPNNQTVSLGSNATFSVRASGVVPFSYQWQFGGTNIAGATSSSYTVQHASADDSGSYRVSITNAYGSTNSLPATLVVNLAPSNLIGPFGQTVGIGCSVSFSVLADGSSPLTYQWRQNGTNITGATDSFYSIDSVQNSDAGNFDVIVSNSFGTTNSSSALLIVDASGSTISGQVRDGAVGLAGVTVTAGTNSAVTDAVGEYVIRGVQPGTYPIIASKAGYRFNGPLQATVPPCVSSANFSAQYLLSGHVYAGSNGVSGVRILGGLTTDENGAYNFSLPADTYTLTPFKAGYIFRPSSRTVVIPPDATNQDFYSTWLITNITHLANGTVQFVVSGSGRVRIEGSSNLINWVAITTNLTPFIFKDSAAGSVPVRFYRAVLQP